MDQPLYYRFLFDPQDGEVTLSSNDEDHPAHVRYHLDMAEQTGAAQPYHGYAYRVGRGWRLTDWEHNAIDDPFINAAVLRALRKAEGEYHPHPHMDWEEIEDAPEEFDRFHYGLPVS